MSGNLAKVRERSGNLCSIKILIVAAQQNNVPVLNLYCNSCFIRGVYCECGLINVHLFDIVPAISSGKVSENLVIFIWRVVTVSVDPFLQSQIITRKTWVSYLWVLRDVAVGQASDVKFFATCYADGINCMLVCELLSMSTGTRVCWN